MIKVEIVRQMRRLEKIKKWVPIFRAYYGGADVATLAIKYDMSVQYLNKVTKYPYTYPRVNDIFLAWCKVMDITPQYYTRAHELWTTSEVSEEVLNNIKDLPDETNEVQLDIICNKIDALMYPVQHIDDIGDTPTETSKIKIDYSIGFHLLCMGAPFASVANFLGIYVQALIKLCKDPTTAPSELLKTFNEWLQYTEMTFEQFQEAREMNKNARVFELGFNYAEPVKSQPNSAE